MPDTTTTFYGFSKPEVGGSNDTWGAKLNGDLDTIDTLLKAREDSVNRADVLGQGAIVNATTTVPPVVASAGQAWIVGSGATGAWANRDGQVAAWFNAWRFYPPVKGWRVYDQSADVVLTWTGAAWIIAPPAQLPPLANPWINYGQGFTTARYTKGMDGRVSLDGVIQAPPGSPTTLTLFTLLPGYRPVADLVFACWGGGGPFRVDVKANGEVAMQAGDATFSSLSGISFFAA